jgi:hypothetical protein
MPKDEIRVGQAYRSDCDYFARLQRRIDTAHRNYRNALQELRRIQAAETPGPEPATATNQIAKPQNGFVPPTDYVMSPVSPTDVAQALVPAGADTPVGAGERSSPNR